MEFLEFMVRETFRFIPVHWVAFLFLFTPYFAYILFLSTRYGRTRNSGEASSARTIYKDIPKLGVILVPRRLGRL